MGGSASSLVQAALFPVTVTQEAIRTAEGKGAINKRGGLIDTLSGGRARREAGEAAESAATVQRGLQADLTRRQALEESDAAKIATRNAARARSRALSMGGQGRGSTILTGSYGVSGAPNTATKTLLGQ
jgi:hypothetical protein